MYTLFVWLLMSAIVLVARAGGSAGSDPVYVSKTFVLVHGAGQCPFVWTAVNDALEKKGQKVVVVEVPAHGDDYTSPAAFSMDVYRDQVIAAI